MTDTITFPSQRRWLGRIGALLMATTALPGALMADDRPRRAQAPTITLDTITLQARRDDEEVYDKPASSVHISGEQLGRFGILSAADILRGQPGVQVGDGRNGGGADVNIRGIQGQSRVSVTVDGAQQALNVYRGYAGTQQRSYFDPDLISSVAIDKGPGNSALGAIGGSVALSTLNAADILKPGARFGLRLKGEAWDNGVRPPYRLPTTTELAAVPRKDRGGLFGPGARAGSIALAYSSDRLDIVAAHARRTQGNYFAGTKGWAGYRSFDEEGTEKNSAAKSYLPGEEVLNSSSTTESTLLKATVRPAEGHEIELSYRHFDGRFGEIMPSDIFRNDTAGISQYPLGDMRIDAVSARYGYKPGGDLIDFKASVWWTKAQSSQINGVTGPSSQHFDGSRYWSRQANERVGADLSNRSTFTTGAGDFALDLNGAFQFETIGPRAGVITTEADRNGNRALRDGWRSEWGIGGKLEWTPVEDVKLWAGLRYGGFRAQDRNAVATPRSAKGRVLSVANGTNDTGYMFWQPDANGQYTDATDPRLNNGIVFTDTNHPLDGVRYDKYGATGTTLMDGEHEMIVGYSRARRAAERDRGLTPSFGFSWQATPGTMIYASYTQGLRFPALFDATAGTPQTTPGLGLKPERARSIEIGASTTRESLLRNGDSASFKLAYFDSTVKNYISRNYDPTSGNGQMKFHNADSYRASGIELQSRYDNGRLFADLSATRYLRTETCDKAFAKTLRDSGRPSLAATPDCTPGGFQGSYVNAQNPPKYAVNLTLGARLMEQRLMLGGRAVHTSGPTATMTEAWQNGATVPQIAYRPVTVVDLFANYDIGQNATFSASVNNLTDRYYLDPLAQSFMPAPGRTIRVGLTAKF